MSNSEFARKVLTEKLEVLDGSRASGARSRAAVRFEDLAGLLQIAPTMKSGPASSDPVSKADYDALRTDVQEVYNRLLFVAQQIQKHLKS